MKISEEIKQKLRCPSRRNKLQEHSDGYLENIANKTIRYPIINGIPILIANEKSIFSIENFIHEDNTTFDIHQDKLKKILLKLLPDISAIADFINIKYSQQALYT